MSDIDLARLESQAAAVVKLRPGIPLKEFVVCLGFKMDKTKRRTKKGAMVVRDRLNRNALKAVKHLAATGIIQTQKPDALHSQVRVFPACYTPRQRPLFQPASNASRLTCRTYFDPTVKGSAADFLPTPTTPIALEADDMADHFRRLMEAIDQMKTDGKVLGTNQICAKAGIPGNYLSPSCGWSRKGEALEAYNAAIAQMQANAAPTELEPVQEMEEREGVAIAPTTEPETPQPSPTQQLEQRIADLEARNRELRQQLTDQQNQSRQSRLVEVAPVHYIREQAKVWRQTVADMEEDLKSAKDNLAAYERLLALHDDAPILMQPVQNGHLNGNGLVRAN